VILRIDVEFVTTFQPGEGYPPVSGGNNRSCHSPPLPRRRPRWPTAPRRRHDGLPLLGDRENPHISILKVIVNVSFKARFQNPVNRVHRITPCFEKNPSNANSRIIFGQASKFKVDGSRQFFKSRPRVNFSNRVSNQQLYSY